MDQFNDNPSPGALTTRKAAVALARKDYGKVWLGFLQETAKDNINKDTVIIKGLDQTMHADFYMNWSFFLSEKGFNNAEAFSLHVALPRHRPLLFDQQLSLRLLDPAQRGPLRHARVGRFVASWAWGEDDVWSAALRFQKEWDNWKIGGGTPMRTSPTSW